MVEGKTLYKYTGALLPNVKTNYPWTWTQTGAWENVDVTTNGYQTTWVLPIGTDDVDPNYFIIQGMGYGPTTNIFVPCPDHWKSNTPAEGASCTRNWDYDCQGDKAGCKTMPNSRCTNAANNLIASKLYVSNGITVQDRGSCWEDGLSFGCTVQIRGVDSSTGLNCMMTGQDIFAAALDIRSHGHCDKCGSKHLCYGYLVSMDYHFG
jgi:Meiotically up-regulated gene family